LEPLTASASSLAHFFFDILHDLCGRLFGKSQCKHSHISTRATRCTAVYDFCYTLGTGRAAKCPFSKRQIIWIFNFSKICLCVSL
jgi:hypothetical protein